MATKLVYPGEQQITRSSWHVSPRRTEHQLHFEVAFLGAHKGVALCRRGAGRAHGEPITFQILSELNGDWITSGEGCTSSFWLPDLIEQLMVAHMWLKDNAVKVQHGWIFK